MEKVVKIKKEFLNKETLEKYGLKFDKDRYIWKPYVDYGIVIYEENGLVEMNCWDCGYINDIIYHLIADGLVELVEVK